MTEVKLKYRLSDSERHRAMVRRLKKGGAAIRQTLTNEDVDLMHMALGLAGESGEVVDLVKKVIINGHPLDPDQMIEELGDVMFYIQGLLMAIGGDLDVVLRNNIAKLEMRYPAGYSDQASQERVDVK